jgi:predicted RNase H-like HicB family nuclease
VTMPFSDVMFCMEAIVERTFTLEYWIDDGWYVGRLKEVPGVFSQGANLPELEENIKDAYQAVAADRDSFVPSVGILEKELSVQV